MICLSVKQPWARLLFGSKNVENRCWNWSPKRIETFRQTLPRRLLIHSSKTPDHDEESLAYICEKWHPELEYRSLLHGEFAFYGAILGSVELWDLMRVVTSTWHEEGCLGLYVRDPKLFAKPIPWKGQLGFFQVDEGAIDTRVDL
jgi:hypothetical protein